MSLEDIFFVSEKKEREREPEKKIKAFYIAFFVWQANKLISIIVLFVGGAITEHLLHSALSEGVSK